MKRKLIGVLVLTIAFVISGCASGPSLGTPTPLQIVLNAMPAIPIAGNSLNFQFGGDTWIATLNGQNFLAGTFTSEDFIDDDGEGTILTLKQTHVGPAGAGNVAGNIPGGGAVGSAAGLAGRAAKWVATPGPEITLVYRAGPPASLTTP